MSSPVVRQSGVTVTRNLQSIQTQMLTSLSSTSLPVKGICLVVLIFYFFSYSENLFTHLCAVPGYVLPPNFWIWTLITHNFIQTHFLLVVVDIAVVVLSGKLLEPIWGPLQISLFFLIVTSISAILTSLTYVSLYYVSGETKYLFKTYIHGLGAYIGGFCVAVKQLMPDHILFTLPFGKVRNNHVPLIVLICAATLGLAGVLNGPYPLHFSFGILISWIYLRFYQRHSNKGVGDMADEFSFASFFPAPLNVPVAVLSNTVFQFLIKIKVCRKPQRRFDLSAPSPTITVTLPGTDPADAERRKAIAIKALNERLNKTNQEEASWIDMESDEPSDPRIIIHSNKPNPPQHQSESETNNKQEQTASQSESTTNTE